MPVKLLKLYHYTLVLKQSLSCEDLGWIYRITVRNNPVKGHSMMTKVVDYITLYPHEDPTNELSIGRIGNPV